MVHLFSLELPRGVKAQRVVALTDDLARGLEARTVRVQAPVPGTAVVGIEVARKDIQTVHLRGLIESESFADPSATLPLALGVTVAGEPFVADLADMPHVLIAGATGSGKSVLIHSLICSMLFKYGSDRLRLLLIDPKRVELATYQGIPHLVTPIIGDTEEAATWLQWAVEEMEERYKTLAAAGCRSIAEYMEESTPSSKASSDRDPMPYLVIVVDEFADLMMSDTGLAESGVTSLAQKARAVGIHMILATQRPSVDVITGVIKGNLPTRIALQVPSKTDSRTILDENGAEALLGRGDMLYRDGGGEPIRLHGAFLSNKEIQRITAAVK